MGQRKRFRGWLSGIIAAVLWLSQTRGAFPTPALAPLQTYNYSISLPAEAHVVMRDHSGTLPFTIANAPGSSVSIDSVQIAVNAGIYHVSAATTAPEGWSVDTIFNAGGGQAWVRFTTATAAILPGSAQVFEVIVSGPYMGLIPAAATDQLDAVDAGHIEIRGSGQTFTRSGPLPSWTRKSLTLTLAALPGSLGVDELLTLTAYIENRSTAPQANIIPAAPVWNSSDGGGVTLASGPTPTTLTLASGASGSFTWVYTTTATGTGRFTAAAGNLAPATSALKPSGVVLIGNFTADLSLDPTRVISGQQVTVNMTVKNNQNTPLTHITPSALTPWGTADAAWVSGPTPATQPSLAPGATAAFQWVYAITGSIGETYAFTGSATTGAGLPSNVATSPTGRINKYTVTADPRYIPVGSTNQSIAFTVANNGGMPVDEVEFTPPATFNYSSASGGYNGAWSITTGVNPTTIKFYTNNPARYLPPGAQGTFTITFSSLPALAGDYDVAARIVDTGNVADNESATVTLTEFEVVIEAAPSAGIPADGVSTATITATVTRGGTPAVGQTVEFNTTQGALASASETTDANGQAGNTLTAPLSEIDTSALVSALCRGAQDSVTVHFVGYTAANRPPVAGDILTTTPRNTPVTLDALAHASDPDGDPLALTAVGTPAHGAATTDGLTVTYTPTLDFVGTEAFTYTVTDGEFFASAWITVTVEAVNRPPTASDILTSTPRNVPVAVNALAHASDPNGDPLALTAVGTPANGAATFSGPHVTYTPTLDFTGSDAFTYTVTDGEFLASAWITVTVEAVNRPPVAGDILTSTPRNVTIIVDALAHAVDPDGDPLSLVAVGLPANGTATTDGLTVEYTPTLDFTGSDAFTYTVTDGEFLASAWITVTVEAVNRPPTISAFPDRYIEVNTSTGPMPFTIGDAETPPDALFLSTATSNPALTPPGSIVLSGSGTQRTLTITPSIGMTGQARITVTVSDGEASASATLRLTVMEEVIFYAYIPFVIHEIHAPDLVVQSLWITPDSLQVVIKNQGRAAVTPEEVFWVDVYVDPHTVPTQVNQTWEKVGTQGAVWSVLVDRLPLEPGETRTLSLGDPYYWPSLSYIEWPIPPGTWVYAQVDSANAATNYGAVLETHEISGGAYNNIIGVQVGATSQATPKHRVQKPWTLPALETLPPRP